jgi:hypothetical protein
LSARTRSRSSTVVMVLLAGNKKDTWSERQRRVGRDPDEPIVALLASGSVSRQRDYTVRAPG